MNKKSEYYESIEESFDELDSVNGERSVRFIVFGNKVRGTGRFLNMEYDSKVSSISPEIHIEERLDDKLGRFYKGDVCVEVLNGHGHVLGSVELDISELGHTVSPGFSFCPTVRFDDEVRVMEIDNIRVYIDPEVSGY